MSKTLAKKVVSEFSKRLQSSVGYHQELLLAVHLKKHQAALETMLAEQFALNIVVLWEVFLNELLISYLVVSPGRFSKNLEERVYQSMKERFGPSIGQMIEFTFPSELTFARASLLADPKELNISVKSADQLAQKANELLSARYARLFTLEPEDAQFVDFVIATRNFLAHRSGGARTKLKTAIIPLTGANSTLQGSISHIGTYLKTLDSIGNTRSAFIAQRLVEVANKLV